MSYSLSEELKDRCVNLLTESFANIDKAASSFSNKV